MMRLRYIALVIVSIALFSSCEKNTMSKIPQIALIAVKPDSVMKVNLDTCYIEFSLTDGDADIGNDTTSRIFLKDSRYESAGYIPYDFPIIDGSVEDPKKGLQGKCLFLPVPQPEPRTDSIHMVQGDTLSYEFYITDRAGHQSNHLTTHAIIVRP